MNEPTAFPIMLSRCPGYRRQDLTAVFDRMVPELTERKDWSGRTVLLKPNLISGRGSSLACTSSVFLDCAARWFVERGARVRLGDSPAYGTARGVLTRHGMLPSLEKLGVEIRDFTAPVEMQLDNGVIVAIAREALECDLLVNLPRLKAHNQMYITGGVKNFFGTVVGMRKAMMHMVHGDNHAGFADILIRIPFLFPSHITIIDGIEAMHVSGPLDGKSLKLHLVAGSTCPVALDTAVLRLLELPFTESPLFGAAERASLPGCCPENHRYVDGRPEDFHGSAFVAPSTLSPIRFNPFRFLSGTIRRLVLAIRQ